MSRPRQKRAPALRPDYRTWSYGHLLEEHYRRDDADRRREEHINALYAEIDEMRNAEWRNSGMARMVMPIASAKHYSVAGDTVRIRFQVPTDQYQIELSGLSLNMGNDVDYKTARRWRWQMARAWAKTAMRSFDEAMKGHIR